MKITVEVSEVDVRDILRFTGEKKKGPAIVKLLAVGLMQERRRKLSEKAKSGKVKIESPHNEASQKLERKAR